GGEPANRYAGVCVSPACIDKRAGIDAVLKTTVHDELNGACIARGRKNHGTKCCNMSLTTCAYSHSHGNAPFPEIRVEAERKRGGTNLFRQPNSKLHNGSPKGVATTTKALRKCLFASIDGRCYFLDNF